MPKVYENSDNVAQFSHRHCAGEAGRWVWASRGVGGEIESIDQGRRDHARFITGRFSLINPRIWRFHYQICSNPRETVGRDK